MKAIQRLVRWCFCTFLYHSYNLMCFLQLQIYLCVCWMHYTYNIFMFINTIYTLPLTPCFNIFHSIEQYVTLYWPFYKSDVYQPGFQGSAWIVSHSLFFLTLSLYPNTGVHLKQSISFLSLPIELWYSAVVPNTGHCLSHHMRNSYPNTYRFLCLYSRFAE